MTKGSRLFLTLLVVLSLAAAVYVLRFGLWVLSLALFAFNSQKGLQLLSLIAPKVVESVRRDRGSVPPETVAKSDSLVRAGLVMAGLVLVTLTGIAALIVALVG